jgi:hypothetical protein
MTAAEFKRRVALTRMGGRSLHAARLVLVDGLSRYAAAERVGVGIAAVSRAAARIENMQFCKCCGQPMTVSRSA